MLQTVMLLTGFFLWLANSGNPPNGRTGAPFDGSCNNCHSGGGTLNGTVEVTGLPAQIEPSTTYPLTIVLTPTGGNPVRAGYQLVVVDGNNINAGDLATTNSQSGVEFSGGREYIEQRTPKTFTGGAPVSWSFNWTSPATVNGNTVKFYYTGNFANGNGGTTGDIAYEFVQTVPFAGQVPVTASIGEVQNVSCNGGSNGSATVEASGGTPPYTYLWSNGQTTATATNLTAGNYSVTVTGAGGSGSAVAAATVTQPAAINVVANVNGLLTCTTTSVTATASASGGSGGFSFLWSDNQSGSSVQFSQPGTYTVTVTDANNCTKTASVVVNENISPPTAIAVPTATISCLQPTTSLSGQGSSSGAGISYLWTASGGGNILSGANTLTPVVNAAGTYTLQVTNAANGCTATASTIVNSLIQPPTVAISGAQLSCANPTVMLQPVTNAQQATFSWSGPNGFSSNLPNPLVSNPGTYSLTVTNTANGCSGSSSTQVGQDTIAPVAIIASPAYFHCQQSVVALSAQGSSQGAGITYNWTTTDGLLLSGATGLNPAVGAAGTYTLLVANNNNGCTASASVVVTAAVPVSVDSAISTPVTCFGGQDGTATALASGGSGTLSYLWSDGQTSASAGTLAAGVYQLTVTDIDGCSDSLTVVIDQPAPLVSEVLVTSETAVGANDATAKASVSGGRPGYSFLWSTGATADSIGGLSPGIYGLSVTDANGCITSSTFTINALNCSLSAVASATPALCAGNASGTASVEVNNNNLPLTYIWSNGAATATVSGLSAGTYSVTVSDENNCQVVASVVVGEPAPLQMSLSTIATSCPESLDGQISALAAGGVPPYVFSWPGGGNGLGLGVGQYSVVLTDANGCSLLDSVVLGSQDLIPPQILCPPSVTVCSGETVAYAAPTFTDNCSLTGVQPALLQGLPSGSIFPTGETTQLFEIADASGNVARCSFIVQVAAPIEIVVVSVANDVDSSGLGNIQVTVSGGLGVLQYNWTRDGQPVASTEDISNQPPGTYVLTVVDENGCNRQSAPIVIDNLVAVGELVPTQWLQVQPNPASQSVALQAKGSSLREVSLMDGNGRLLRRLLPEEWAGQMDVSMLMPGLYFFRVVDEQQKVFFIRWIKS